MLLLRRPIVRIAVACLCAIGGLAGCGANPNPDRIKGPRTANPDPVPLAGYPNVLLRGTLDQQLVLLGDPVVIPATARMPMEVRVRLRNASDFDAAVQYRFKFYGRAREPLSDNPVWYNEVLPATHDRTFSANSVSLEAVDWELEVKRDN